MVLGYGKLQSGSVIDLAVFAPNLEHSDLMDFTVHIEDLHLLYEIDCLDYYRIDNPSLRQHIDQEGKTFYVKEKA